jgi:zinc protease
MRPYQRDIFAAAMELLVPDAASAAPTIEHFALANGMEVVVIPDHRAPVATHMVWYRNGAADDPAGKSGIAHFLEHLMFKGTPENPKGVFSEIVAELGGQENAFTSVDYTAYFQRIDKAHLGRMMQLEADRMVNLVLEDGEVASERDVVLEERRMYYDSDPAAQLYEVLSSTLFSHHPYGTPVIGWEHEIEGLSREDALTYYRRFYTPENAVLVVAGDVAREEVRVLAEASYGRLPRRNAAPERSRPMEPPARAHRLVSLADEKVEQETLHKIIAAPSFHRPGDADPYALDALAHILGGGAVSRLYTRLVMEQEIAVGAGASYWGSTLDHGRIHVSAVPREGVTLEALDKAVLAVIDEIVAGGVTDEELERTKTRLIADMVYAQDNQTTLARMYGSTLTSGLSIDFLQGYPARIEALTRADLAKAAADCLAFDKGVTGYLLKAA